MAFPDGEEEESLVAVVVAIAIAIEADIQAAVGEDILVAVAVAVAVAAVVEVLRVEEDILDVVAVVPLQQAWQTTVVLLAPWSTSFWR